jgi:hypothetical protein
MPMLEAQLEALLRMPSPEAIDVASFNAGGRPKLEAARPREIGARSC